MYAMELVNDSHTEEAAVMFVRAEDFQNALFHFENTSNWRMSLCMAYKLNLQQEDISALARRLASKSITCDSMLLYHADSLTPHLVTLFCYIYHTDLLIPHRLALCCHIKQAY